MKKRKDEKRRLQPIREYHPWVPRKLMTREEMSRGVFPAEVEKLFDPEEPKIKRAVKSRET